MLVSCSLASRVGLVVVQSMTSGSRSSTQMSMNLNRLMTFFRYWIGYWIILLVSCLATLDLQVLKLNKTPGVCNGKTKT